MVNSVYDGSEIAAGTSARSHGAVANAMYGTAGTSPGSHSAVANTTSTVYAIPFEMGAGGTQISTTATTVFAAATGRSGVAGGGEYLIVDSADQTIA